MTTPSLTKEQKTENLRYLVQLADNIRSTQRAYMLERNRNPGQRTEYLELLGKAVAAAAEAYDSAREILKV